MKKYEVHFYKMAIPYKIGRKCGKRTVKARNADEAVAKVRASSKVHWLGLKYVKEINDD